LGGVSLLPGNRLAAANGDSFEYTDRDHIAKRDGPGGAVSYFYDSRDMLVRIEDRFRTWEFSYDALGRRTRKTVGGRSTEYFWDTDRLAAEISEAGRLRVYIYLNSLALAPLLFLDYDSIDAEPGSGASYFIFSNHLGAPVLIEDEAGRTVWQCTYTEYGLAHIDRSSTIEYHLRFPGHYFDAETGLHYNRFRYYSPELGRYLQCDPEGIAGGLNLYAYTENPLVQVDIRGLGCKTHSSMSDPDCEDCRNVNRAEFRNSKASRAPKAQRLDLVHSRAVGEAKRIKAEHEKETRRIQEMMDKDKLQLKQAGVSENEANKRINEKYKGAIKPLPICTVAVRDTRTRKVYFETSGPPALKPSEAHNDLNMPLQSKEVWAPGNCGEPKAINRALKDGARKEDLQVAAVNTENQTVKQLCRNCVDTTRGTSVYPASSRR
jgi:RHS repeat-associated protein